MTQQARDRLLDKAVELFYRDGCTATGIDRLLAQAGVAKMTLYKNFGSKQNLVLAAAERMRDAHHQRVREWLDGHADTARGKLLALFDFIEHWVSSRDFHGCPFINIATEFSNPDHPAHKAAASYKHEQYRYFLALAREAGICDPDIFTDRLVVLIEGAVALSYVTGNHKPIATAREMAAEMIEQMTPAANPSGPRG